MRRFQQIEATLDPELAARIRRVVTNRLNRHLDRMEEDDCAPDLPDHNDHLQKSVTNYGVKWMENYAARERAKAAKIRRESEDARCLADYAAFLTGKQEPEEPETNSSPAKLDTDDLIAEVEVDIAAIAELKQKHGG